MLKRKLMNTLLDWKKRDNKVALLIKGARQVGKTYLIREFGKKYYKSFIEINFEREKQFKKIFDGDLSARNILMNLSAMGLGNFIENETLIFFDEIQSCPNARTAIKFLVEDGRFDYIESGSLLGISYKEVSSYPVGYEEQVTLFPLDFEEFLWAKGIGAEVIDTLRQGYINMTPISDFLHSQMMKHYHDYLVVGGMPKVVTTFLENSIFDNVIREQNNIIESYRDDIAKYANENKVMIKKMFDLIPSQLNQKNKRFILADLQKGATAAKFANHSMWISEAGIAHNCFNAGSIDINLGLHSKRSLYKLYMLDTGLLCCMSLRGIQSAILQGDIDINEGSIVENSMAATLASKKIPLYYYDLKGRMELDFLFSDSSGLTIIEVKSGRTYKKHISLDYTLKITNKQIFRRLVFCRGNIEKNKNGIIYYPLYMSMFL